ncbi:MAG: SDR family NAD(P)-dependent oxidoreductase, partial [Halieaceae bacterium]|nr:SDR family NAD(P)-dependent oxidoreductase [Halieaceae bacterium]
MSYHKPHMPIISNVTGERAGEEMADAAYWVEHVLAPVRFANGMEALSQEEVTAFVEVGPQPVLLGMGQQCLPEHEGLWLPSLRRGQDDWQQMLQTLGQLYTQGVDVDWAGFERDYNRRKVVLPTYPFQRKRYWVDTRRRGRPADMAFDPLLGERHLLASGDVLYENVLDCAELPFLEEHQAFGEIIYPAAGYVSLALHATELPATVKDLNIHEGLFLESNQGTPIQVHLHNTESGRRFQIYSRQEQEHWTLHGEGVLGEGEGEADERAIDSPFDLKRLTTDHLLLSREEIYSQFGSMYLGPRFQGLARSWSAEQDAIGEFIMPELMQEDEDMMVHPAMLDVLFQLGAMLSLHADHEDSDDLYLPVQVGRLQLVAPLTEHFYCRGRLHDIQTGAETRIVDLQVWAPDGRVLCEVEGLVFKRARRQAILARRRHQVDHLLYEIAWQITPALAGEADETISGRWLLVSDQRDWSQDVAAALHDAGQRCEVVQLGNDHEDSFHVSDPADVEEWLALLAKVDGSDSDTLPDEDALSGVIWQVGIDEHSDGLAQLRPGCGGALALVQALLRSGSVQLSQGLWMMSRGGVAVEEGLDVNPEASAIWGLGRTLMEEQPSLRCRLLDLGERVPPAAELVNYLLTAATGNEGQHAFHQGQWHVPRLARVANERLNDQETLLIEAEASYMITGGLGALGLHSARWLVDKGAERIVLSSRRLPDESTQLLLNELGAEGVAIEVVAADVADKADVERLMAVANADAERPLRGVIHAAGVVDDGVLSEQNWERFESVLRPKVLGAQHLHEVTREMTLDFFVLYSSVVSLLGSLSQSNYGAANAFLDGLALQRGAEGLPGLSLNWGPWSGSGLAGRTRGLDARLARIGMQKLAPQQGVDVLERLLNSSVNQAGVLAVDWNRYPQTDTMREYVSRLTPRTLEITEGKSALVQQLEETPTERRVSVLVSFLKSQVQEVLGLKDAPDLQQGFFDIGMDSLMAVEVGRRLQQQLALKQALSSTALFDYPTIETLANHLLQQLQLTDIEKVTTPRQTVDAQEPIAIVGLACRFPGGADAEAFWQMLAAGEDSNREVPAERWDIDAYYDPDPDVPGKMWTRRGNFIDDVDQFDASFFEIAPREAMFVDPQHRLLLEVVWEALENTGIDPNTLMGSETGVFMGISAHDYGRVMAKHTGDDAISAYFGIGGAPSGGSGRISYTLGLQGPSFSVATACSSSLVATHNACISLRNGECDMALSGGVSLIFDPRISISFTKARMLSPGGYCKTFDEAADGYSRGEGCGVIVLKRLSDAERNGDRILAVIRGSAINQDGRSSGLTAPNGPSQERVIADALAQAGVLPEQVDYLECHGTGTPLGDPIEVQAAARVLGQDRASEHPLLLGSVKTNIGHLETAAGISGLIKVVLSLQHKAIPPHLNYETPNSKIPWHELAVAVNTALRPWPEQVGKTRVGSVSSFGFTGTNAHVILEQAPDVPPSPTSEAEPPERSWHVLPISAKTETALPVLAERYLQHLHEHNDIPLADLCYTAGAGRSHFAHRAALAIQNVDVLKEQLQALAQGQAAAGLYSSKTVTVPKTAWLFTGQGSQYAGM